MIANVCAVDYYLIKVTTSELTQQKDLFDCFFDALSTRVDAVDKESEAVVIRKLCNTRLNKFKTTRLV